jgi:putative transcription antitermination factor YqgF
MRTSLTFSIFILNLSLYSGCATTASKVNAPDLSAAQEAYTDNDLIVLAEPSGPDALQFYDSELLYLRAVDLMSGGAYEEAIFYFEKLIREFPKSEYVMPARYNLGNCFLQLRESDRAMESMTLYLELLPADATPQDRADAIFRQGHIYAQKREYETMAKLFDKAVKEMISTPMRIEAKVNAGIGYFMLEQDEIAFERFTNARQSYMDAPRKDRIEAKYHAAQSLFYLAELKRKIYTDYDIVMPSSQELNKDGQTLEEVLIKHLQTKCRHLMNAQRAYVRTIRDGHAGWAAAAGYKVGTLYENLYDNLEHLPLPDDLTELEKDVYEEMVKEKIAVLLRKAVRIWEMNMRMAIRSGAENVWVERTSISISRIKNYISEEEEEKIMKKHDMRQAVMIEAAFFPKRVLGADLGLQKTGLAISDELGVSVRGLETFKTKSRKEDIAKMVNIVRESNIEAVIIGYPILPNSKDEGMMAKRARGFSEALQETLIEEDLDVAVFLEDETGSTNEAAKRLAKSQVKKSKRKGMRDSEAARIIVERFLERVQTQEAAQKKKKELTEPSKDSST